MESYTKIRFEETIMLLNKGKFKTRDTQYKG